MDNFFQTCPAKMEDQGRQLSDFQSSTSRDEYIKRINNIRRDDQYRLFLQTNGKAIMDREWAFNKRYNSCWANECVHHYPTRCLQKQYLQERQAYDSIFNKNTNQEMSPLRKCTQYKDFRMTSDN